MDNGLGVGIRLSNPMKRYTRFASASFHRVRRDSRFSGARGAALIIGEQGELAADGEQVDQPDDHFDSHLSRLETLDLLEASKQNYQGVARLGIEALALKVQGMRITDIAALYQVPPSHVGAWISRSLEKLRNDPDFLTCLL